MSVAIDTGEDRVSVTYSAKHETVAIDSMKQSKCILNQFSIRQSLSIVSGIE